MGREPLVRSVEQRWGVEDAILESSESPAQSRRSHRDGRVNHEPRVRGRAKTTVSQLSQRKFGWYTGPEPFRIGRRHGHQQHCLESPRRASVPGRREPSAHFVRLQCWPGKAFLLARCSLRGRRRLGAGCQRDLRSLAGCAWRDAIRLAGLRSSLTENSLASAHCVRGAFVRVPEARRPLSFPSYRLNRPAHPCRLNRPAHPCRLNRPAHPSTAHESHTLPSRFARSLRSLTHSSTGRRSCSSLRSCAVAGAPGAGCQRDLRSLAGCEQCLRSLHSRRPRTRV